MHVVIRGFPFSHTIIHDLHNIWMSRYFGLIFAIALFFSDKVYIGPLFPWTFEECGQSPPNDNFKWINRLLKSSLHWNVKQVTLCCHEILPHLFTECKPRECKDIILQFKTVMNNSSCKLQTLMIGGKTVTSTPRKLHQQRRTIHHAKTDQRKKPFLVNSSCYR